jgi:putative SOS response-associated peptidase YedK
MCNWFDSRLQAEKLGYLFGAKLNIPNHFEGRHKTSPTNPSFVVRNGEEDQRQVDIFEFGLVPHWSKNKDRQYSTTNARDDKLMSSNLWRPCFQNKRCIIPASGFFEHHTLDQDVNLEGGKKPTNKVPYYFKLKSHEVFGFAGLYDEWEDTESGQTVGTFSIITTEANPLLTKIHNQKERMPTILREEDYDFWLDENVNPQDYFDQNIFTPYPEDDMDAWQVTKQFDYGKNDDEVIKPVKNPMDLDNPDPQGSLFG